MLPVTVFADVEAWACTWLRDQLANRPEPYATNVHVTTSVPDPRRPRMVIVRRDGGVRLDVVRETARLGIRVWGATEEETADLTLLVRALLAASVGEGPVRGFRESAGPVSVADESQRPLRYVVVELTCRSPI